MIYIDFVVIMIQTFLLYFFAAIEQKIMSKILKLHEKINRKRRRCDNEFILNKLIDISLNIFSIEFIIIIFPPSSLSNRQLFRMIISKMSPKQKASIYATDFDKKGYILASRIEKGEPALIEHEGQSHYAIVYISRRSHQNDTCTHSNYTEYAFSTLSAQPCHSDGGGGIVLR